MSVPLLEQLPPLADATSKSYLIPPHRQSNPGSEQIAASVLLDELPLLPLPVADPTLEHPHILVAVLEQLVGRHQRPAGNKGIHMRDRHTEGHMPLCVRSERSGARNRFAVETMARTVAAPKCGSHMQSPCLIAVWTGAIILLQVPAKVAQQDHAALWVRHLQNLLRKMRVGLCAHRWSGT